MHVTSSMLALCIFLAQRWESERKEEGVCVRSNTGSSGESREVEQARGSGCKVSFCKKVQLRFAHFLRDQRNDNEEREGGWSLYFPVMLKIKSAEALQIRHSSKAQLYMLSVEIRWIDRAHAHDWEELALKRFTHDFAPTGVSTGE